MYFQELYNCIGKNKSDGAMHHFTMLQAQVLSKS